MKDPIRDLAQTLKPFQSMDSFKTFIGKWFFYSAMIVLIGHKILPVREDFSLKYTNLSFEIENGLWLLISILSAVIFYFSVFPEKEESKAIKIPTYFALASLFLVVFSRMDFQHPINEFHTEMDLWRGGCGFIILIIASIQSFFLILWARKSAPNNVYITGFWAALSCSAVGCLLMQFVCARDSSAHLFLWHFVPVTLISFGGGTLARKILRW
jgi:hypothetical protein